MKILALVSSLFYAAAAIANNTNHTESAIPFEQIGWQAANLGILLFALIYFTKKSVIKTFENRKKEFLEKAEKTKSALKNAEATLAAIKTKLSELEAGEQKSLQAAQSEAVAQRLGIIRDAEALGEKIKKEAAQIITNELAKAKNEINMEILNHAVRASKKSLIENSQANSLSQEAAFIKQLERVKA